MEIYLIRHGKTIGNLQKRYVGRTDEPLCEVGYKELEQIKRQEKYPKVEIVFSSPMIRCIRTADILYPERRKKIVPDFYEMNFGAFEYQNYEMLSGDERYQAWIDSGGSISFPGGESREQFENRCVRAFEGTLLQCERDIRNIAYIIHGGTIMAILHAFGVPKQDYYSYQCKNGEGYYCVAQKDRGNWQLKEVKKIV